MRVCEICGKEYADHLLSCPHCGAVPDPAALKDATAMFDALLADDPLPLYEPEFDPIQENVSDFVSEVREEDPAVPETEPDETDSDLTATPSPVTDNEEKPKEILSSGDTREFTPLGDTAEFPAIHEKQPAEEDHNDPERTRKVLEMYGGSAEETPSAPIGAGILDWFDELRHSALSLFRRPTRKTDADTSSGSDPAPESAENIPADEEISPDSVDKLFGFTAEDVVSNMVQEDLPEDAEFLTSLPFEEEGTIFDDLMDSDPVSAEEFDAEAVSDEVPDSEGYPGQESDPVPEEETVPDATLPAEEPAVPEEAAESDAKLFPSDEPVTEDVNAFGEGSMPDAVSAQEEIAETAEIPSQDETPETETGEIPVSDEGLPDETVSVPDSNTETAGQDLNAGADLPEAEETGSGDSSSDVEEKPSDEEITAWLHELTGKDAAPAPDDTLTEAIPEEGPDSEIPAAAETAETVSPADVTASESEKASEVSSLFRPDEDDTPQEGLLRARGLKRGGVIFLALLAIAGILLGVFKYYLPKLRAEEQAAADRESAYQDLVCGTWMSDVFIYADEVHPSREVLTLGRDYSYKCDIWTSSSDREAFDPEIWSVTDTIEGTYFLELDAGSIRVTYTGPDGEEHVYRRFVRDAGGDKLVLREYYNENLTEYFDVEFERYNEKIR